MINAQEDKVMKKLTRASAYLVTYAREIVKYATEAQTEEKTDELFRDYELALKYSQKYHEAAAQAYKMAAEANEEGLDIKYSIMPELESLVKGHIKDIEKVVERRRKSLGLKSLQALKRKIKLRG
ncbi:hypothetical protein GOV14_03330 [Candidatus Pacearchaeota archaeon]|nr:hypothetical protein [Candidatus Pacearchaeota archaeon]